MPIKCVQQSVRLGLLNIAYSGNNNASSLNFGNPTSGDLM